MEDLVGVKKCHDGSFWRGKRPLPHNWRSLNGFLQEVRRIWFNCLKRRSQKNRRMGWDWFEALTARLPLPAPRITRPWAPRAG
jgi:hypothetical protein